MQVQQGPPGSSSSGGSSGSVHHQWRCGPVMSVRVQTVAPYEIERLDEPRSCSDSGGSEIRHKLHFSVKVSLWRVLILSCRLYEDYCLKITCKSLIWARKSEL